MLDWHCMISCQKLCFERCKWLENSIDCPLMQRNMQLNALYSYISQANTISSLLSVGLNKIRAFFFQQFQAWKNLKLWIKPHWNVVPILQVVLQILVPIFLLRQVPRVIPCCRCSKCGYVVESVSMSVVTLQCCSLCLLNGDPRIIPESQVSHTNSTIDNLP